MKQRSLIYIAVTMAILSTVSCSINKLAMKKVADVLSAPGGSTVFTGDNDPELVGAALPFAIKMYESLMVSIPHHEGLKLKTGSIYVMYANAFVHTPASMLTEEEYKKQEFMYKRAKNLYLRGRDILLDALDAKHKGFRDALHKKQYAQALGSMTKEDVPMMYWAAAGWLGAFAIDPFDMKLGLTVPQAAAIMERVLVLEPGFGNGAIHEFYVLYYGSMPDYMGGDFTKARKHFKKAKAVSGGKSTSAYVSLATTISVQEQNLEEFTTLLNQVLKMDPDKDPGNRLVHTLNHRKARWLLEHLGDFFLEAGPSEENSDNQLNLEDEENEI
jgi:predicted anti-sigma-YlaC factor YlaD